MSGFEALAHPIRLRIVRHLSEHGPASLGELAEAAEVHENTARAHILVMKDGGLITAEPRPIDRPGRPGVNYRLANAHLIAPTQLAQLLAAALDRAGPNDDELRATGRDWGRYLAGRPAPHRIETKVPEVLERIGFRGEVRDDGVELRGCPCATLLPDRPLLVCCLAEGVVDGAIAASGGSHHVGAAEHDPERRACRIELVEAPGRSAAPTPDEGRHRRARWDLRSDPC